MDLELELDDCEKVDISDLELRKLIIKRFLAKIDKHKKVNIGILCRDLKRASVEATLMTNGNNQSAAAETLGISRSTISTYNHIKTSKLPTRRVYRRKGKYGKD